jgi:hypothetical protein
MFQKRNPLYFQNAGWVLVPLTVARTAGAAAIDRMIGAPHHNTCLQPLFQPLINRTLCIMQGIRRKIQYNNNDTCYDTVNTK